MLTKKQAHLLAAYEFKLITKTGTIVEIISVDEDDIKIGNSGAKFYIGFDDIGVDFFILCRPYSQLTEEIEHDGERFKPILRLLWEYNFNTDVMQENEINEYAESMIEIDMSATVSDFILTWNFKPQWLDEKFVKYI